MLICGICGQKNSKTLNAELKTLFLIGIGGGVGSIFRYLTSVFVTKYFQTAFPLATFAVNFAGCLIIGVLLGLFERHQLASSDLKILLVTGFCGGFTTFSAFAAENINLFQTGHSFTALLYIAASVLVGLLAVWLGLVLVK